MDYEFCWIHHLAVWIRLMFPVRPYTPEIVSRSVFHFGYGSPVRPVECHRPLFDCDFWVPVEAIHLKKECLGDPIKYTASIRTCHMHTLSCYYDVNGM